MKKELKDKSLSRRGLEILSKKEHLKYQEKNNIRIYIFALITFIICSIILLYFTSNSSERSNLILDSNELEIFKELLKKYKEEDILKDDKAKSEEEEIKSDPYEIDFQKRKNIKNLIIEDLYRLVNEKNKISKEKLSEILDYLLEKNFNEKYKEEYILLNGVTKKNENNLNREYKNNEESESKKLENISNNLKYVSTFYEFMKEHKKDYKNLKEKMEKYENFKINYLEIEKHNKGNNLYKKKVNKFSDYSKKDLERYVKKLIPVSAHLVEKHAKPFSATIKSEKTDENSSENKKENEGIFSKYPENLDYREKGIIHEPKDQGSCGSCWAFSGIGNIESIYAKKNKKLLSLSEQEVVDCSKSAFGCDGGHAFYTFLYALENQICLEEQYKYEQMDDLFCLKYRCTNKISLTDIGSVKENELIQALNEVGPVSVNVGASDDFVFYHEGIFNGVCDEELNHAVLLIGYGQVQKNKKYNENKSVQKFKETTDENDNFIYYWIIKNSWGKNWGENGFMRIIRNKNGDNLFCGIGVEVFYPIL